MTLGICRLVTRGYSCVGRREVSGQGWYHLSRDTLIGSPRPSLWGGGQSRWLSLGSLMWGFLSDTTLSLIQLL